MSGFLLELAFGVLLGFTLTVPPGPMNAFIASRAVRSFREGFVAGFGAMSADAVLGGLVFALHAEVDLSAALRWIYLVGAAVMVFLGVSLLRQSPEAARPGAGEARTYLKALGLGLSNPFQIAWWLTAGLGFAYLGGWVLFAGLFGAVGAWIVAFPWALHLGARRRPRVARAVVVASGVVIFAFAAYFLFLAV